MATTLSAQQKFISLRRRLDQLGYQQPLGIETMPLVEQLFVDLLQTTESLKRIKAELDRLSGSGDFTGTGKPRGDTEKESNAGLEAYKMDNARLVKENNTLHQDLMKLKEQLESSNKELKTTLRKTQNENSDLKFLNNQYLHNMQTLEAESKLKSERILQLQEKNFHAVVQTPGGKRKNIPFRRQRMEVDYMLPESQRVARPAVASTVRPDVYILDILKLADDSIDKLRLEAREACEAREGLQARVDTLKKQLDSRDREIERLVRQLDGGRTLDVVALESKNRTDERLISHLNMQIDHLQQRNTELQNVLEESRETSGSFRGRDLMTSDLHTGAGAHGGIEVNMTNKHSPDVISSTAQLEELSETKEMLRKLHEEFSSYKRDQQKSQQAQSVLQAQVLELDRLQERLETELHNNKQLQHKIEGLSAENKSLNTRLNKLLITEKELVLELDKVTGGKNKKGRQGNLPPWQPASSTHQHTKPPGVVESFIRHLEEEKDRWKNEVKSLRRQLKSRSGHTDLHQRSGAKVDHRSRSGSNQGQGRDSGAESGPRSRSGSSQGQMRSMRGLRSRSGSDERSSPGSEERHSAPSSPAGRRNRNTARVDSEAVLRYEELLERVRGERDGYMRERDGYMRECESLRSTVDRMRSGQSSTSGSKCNHEADLLELRRERDSLQNVLDRFEAHLREIQQNVKTVTKERDELLQLYNQAREELKRLKSVGLDGAHVAGGAPVVKHSLAAQTQIRHLENERDDALAELRSVSIDRNTLKEKLQFVTESHVSDRKKLERNIEDLETSLRTLETERSGLEERFRLSKSYTDDLEKHLRSKDQQIEQLQQEMSEIKTSYNQLRTLVDQSELAGREREELLGRRDAVLRELEGQVSALQEEIGAVKRAGEGDRAEVIRLRETVGALDREKDYLQSIVDEKVELEVGRAEILNNKDATIADLRASISDLDKNINDLRGVVNQKEQEVSSLRRQLDKTLDDLTEVKRAREASVAEVRRLEGDVLVMTRENQSVHRELNEALRCLESARHQVNEYLAECKRCQEIIAAKEVERQDIVEQYRSLSKGAEQCEARANHIEADNARLKLEIINKDLEIRRFRERVEQAELQIQQHMTTEHQYELELSKMNKSVAGLEELLRAHAADKDTLHTDLLNTRELCSKHEANRDSLQRQLVAKNINCEKLEALLEELRAECDTLRTQLSGERASRQNIESLLTGNRAKEWQAQLSLEGKDSEIKQLTDRLNDNNNKIESQNRELNTLRQRALEQESDLERAKRQLISERFERERAIQELKKNGLSLPGEGTRLGLISPTRSIHEEVIPSSASRTFRRLVPTSSSGNMEIPAGNYQPGENKRGAYGTSKAPPISSSSSNQDTERNANQSNSTNQNVPFSRSSYNVDSRQISISKASASTTSNLSSAAVSSSATTFSAATSATTFSAAASATTFSAAATTVVSTFSRATSTSSGAAISSRLTTSSTTTTSLSSSRPLSSRAQYSGSTTTSSAFPVLSSSVFTPGSGSTAQRFAGNTGGIGSTKSVSFTTSGSSAGRSTAGVFVSSGSSVAQQGGGGISTASGTVPAGSGISVGNLPTISGTQPTSFTSSKQNTSGSSQPVLSSFTSISPITTSLIYSPDGDTGSVSATKADAAQTRFKPSSSTMIREVDQTLGWVGSGESNSSSRNVGISSVNSADMRINSVNSDDRQSHDLIDSGRSHVSTNDIALIESDSSLESFDSSGRRDFNSAQRYSPSDSCHSASPREEAGLRGVTPR